MRLKNRLDKLETMFKVDDDPQAEKQRREYIRSWIANDQEGRTLFKQFEDHCMKSGHYKNGKESMVELTRTDPVAAELARRYLESYRSYVKTNFGVMTSAVSSALG